MDFRVNYRKYTTKQLFRNYHAGRRYIDWLARSDFVSVGFWGPVRMENQFVSLQAYLAQHPQWSAERATRRWASLIFSAWDDGVPLPEALLLELAQNKPVFAPDHLATEEVLRVRYSKLVTLALENAHARLELEHAELVRKLDFKRYKRDLAQYACLRERIQACFAELNGIRDELSQRSQGVLSGDRGKALMARLIERRAAARARVSETP